MTVNERDSHRDRHVLMYVAAVAVAAFSMTTVLVVVQRTYFFSQSNWAIFGLFAVLLLLGETQPSFSMRFGDNGEVSPGWTFAFALMLFGMPVGALIVMVIANIIVDLRLQNPARMVVFNASQIALAMSAGALVLQLFGLRGSMTKLDRIPLEWGLGILAAAATMLILNGVLTAVVIGLHTGAGFFATFRTGLALSMTADGALLSLAPVFVIAVDYSFVLVPLLATTSYIVIRSARNSLQRAHDANHDPLTGLLNRRVFDERLNSAVGVAGSEHETVVLVMDFDRFKEINDSLGHAVGDALLSSFAERLNRLLPPIASAARLGGDEFAVVIPGPQSGITPEEAIAVLHAQLTEPFEIQGFPLSVSVSIGVAIGPDDGTNAEDLLAAADLAMYRAKQSETDVVHYGSTVSPRAKSSSQGATGRIDLLSELAKAIAADQLIAHYQPQVSMATGAIDTVEALVRWEHPRHGLIPPNDFIAMAEQTDLIDNLTEFMLRRSMAEILEFDHLDISLAVNISPRSLLQRRFAGVVLGCLGDTGFPADRLELEITERAIADDPERTGLTVARLRDAGVRFAIDDFGTGYSSFSSLRQIRADRLKIDQRFTKQIVASHEDLVGGAHHHPTRARARPGRRRRGCRDRRDHGGPRRLARRLCPGVRHRPTRSLRPVADAGRRVAFQDDGADRRVIPGVDRRMIVLVLTAVGVASALYNRDRITRFAQLSLDGLWLVWVAILLQVVVFELLGADLPLWASNGLHLVSYGFCVAFLWRNRRVPGSWIIGAGHRLQSDRDHRERRHDAGRCRRMATCRTPRVRSGCLREFASVVVAPPGVPRRRVRNPCRLAAGERVQRRRRADRDRWDLSRPSLVQYADAAESGLVGGLGPPGARQRSNHDWLDCDLVRRGI